MSPSVSTTVGHLCRSVEANGLFPIEELLEDNRAPHEPNIPALVGPGFRAPAGASRPSASARSWHRQNASAILEGVEVAVAENPEVAALEEVTSHLVDGTFLQVRPGHIVTWV